MTLCIQKKLAFSILPGLLSLLSFSATVAQVHDVLFHPSFRDEYLTTQVLPEGGIRIFFVADQNNGWTFREVQYLDAFPDSISPFSPPITILTPDDYINYLVQNAFVLRLQDGSTIIADYFFDCDYGHAGSIFKLNAAGTIEWWHNLVEDFQVYEVVGLGFVDDNVIGIDAWSSMFRLTTNGIPIFSSVSQRVPEQSIQTPFGYILCYSDSLEIRNASFELTAWYQLDGYIQSIDPIDSHSYRIKTSSKYYELDHELQLTYLPLDASTLWSSPAAYWQYANQIEAVVQYDTFFAPVDTFPLSPGVVPLAGAHIQDRLVTMCKYTNEVSMGLVSFMDSIDAVNFDLPQDIGVTDIVFPDSVLAEFFNSTVPWSGWSYTYDWVEVQITNYGETPVSRFFIQGHDLLDCFWWCYAPVPYWQIDSLLLLPGEQAWVRLPGFTTRCDWQSFDPSLCLSAVAPNERADGFYLNDTWCESFDIILQDEPPVPKRDLTIFPNPASDVVNIMIDGFMDDQTMIQVLNASGVEVESVQVQGQRTTITLADIPTGIYFIKLTDQKGWNAISKLAVVR